MPLESRTVPGLTVTTPRFHSPPREQRVQDSPPQPPRSSLVTSRGVLWDGDSSGGVCSDERLHEQVQQVLRSSGGPGSGQSASGTTRLPLRLPSVNAAAQPPTSSTVAWRLGYVSPRRRGMPVGPGQDWKMTCRGCEWVGNPDEPSCTIPASARGSTSAGRETSVWAASAQDDFEKLKPKGPDALWTFIQDGGWRNSLVLPRAQGGLRARAQGPDPETANDAAEMAADDSAGRAANAAAD